MPIPGVAPVIDAPIDDTPIPEFIPKRSVRSIITWTSGGEEIVLTAGWQGYQPGMAVGQGIKGFDASPVNLILDDLPSQPGSAFRQMRETTRELFIPMVIWATNRDEFLILKRDLLNKLITRLGVPGVLSVYETTADGDVNVRSIDCFYAGGLEGDEEDAGYLTYAKYGLVLRAPDPFWYGPEEVKPYGLAGASPVNFFTGKDRGSVGETTGPFLSFHGLSKVWVATGETQDISILGDVETWPVWTIHGKNAAQFSLINNTTGKSLVLNYNFGSGGDTVVIDTRPGVKSAVNGAGVSVWEYFSPNPKLWEFLPGDNNVSLALTLAGGALSTSITGDITLSYKPRFQGA